MSCVGSNVQTASAGVNCFPLGGSPLAVNAGDALGATMPAGMSVIAAVSTCTTGYMLNVTGCATGTALMTQGEVEVQACFCPALPSDGGVVGADAGTDAGNASDAGAPDAGAAVDAGAAPDASAVAAQGANVGCGCHSAAGAAWTLALALVPWRRRRKK